MKHIEGELAEAPRAAASVVVVRDAPGGLEVFLLRRHTRSNIGAGLFVFPGGKVDEADAQVDPHAHLDRPAVQLHGALGEPELSEAEALALHVAAVRELFEEAGVLMARDMTPELEARAAALAAEKLEFNETLARLGIRLDTHGLVPWTRWITPKASMNMNRRFDTRFFVARMPPGGDARHADDESTESVWIKPRAAIERYWNGEMALIPPQIMTMAHLARYASTEEALAHGRSRPPPTIRPEHFDLDGVRVICYPGDERHSVRERAMPGPTRLMLRNERHEPVDGFEALFN